MNHSKNLLAAGVLLALNAATAQATLFDRGNGLIYDSDQNITWLQNANQGALAPCDFKKWTAGIFYSFCGSDAYVATNVNIAM